MKKLAMGAGLGLAMMVAAWAHGPGGQNVDWNNPQFKQEKAALMAEFQALEARKQQLMQELHQAKASGGDMSQLESRKQALMAEHKALEQKKHALMARYPATGGQKGPWQKGPGANKAGWQKQKWEKPAGK